MATAYRGFQGEMATGKGKFSNKFNELQSVVNDWIEDAFGGEAAHTLEEACSYSICSPGKRIRPVLSLLAGECLGISKQSLKPFVISLECIHAASLIHDDLPALDNDSLRRGLPTCHAKFGEALAVMAGDALIAKAFLFLTDNKLETSLQGQLVGELAKTTEKLCLGQVFDLEASKSQSVSLEERHHLKTGALMALSAAGPALYLGNGAGQRAFSQLSSFGKQFGLLFQITDDILDETSSAEKMGKNAFSDIEKGTPTYVTEYGIEGAQKLAEETSQAAKTALLSLPGNTSLLSELCDFVLLRER